MSICDLLTVMVVLKEWPMDCFFGGVEIEGFPDISALGFGGGWGERAKMGEEGACPFASLCVCSWFLEEYNYYVR